MKDALKWLLLLVLAVCGIAAYYYWLRPNAPPASPALPAVQPVPVTPPPPPPIRHPIPQPPAASVVAPGPQAPPLPPLDSSDAAAKDALASVFGQSQLEKLFNLQNLVRRIVVSVDNATQRRLPLNYMPLKPAPGTFTVDGDGDSMTLSPANFRRYRPYVALAQAVDVQKLADVYVHFYPLFQQAYEELGYPSRYFNDRLIEVIDQLLATPDVQGPIKLVRPSVMYKFADPDLESLSAGQKILIRIGPENARVIKTKLRALRAVLTRQGPVH